ncbi:hypothetical protein MPSEU_000449200 [Mayamaea pseudoterrestris]|nr:hypothetical protein MPSEU_000449200 [Mayamaea pseudoterrestris]
MLFLLLLRCGSKHKSRSDQNTSKVASLPSSLSPSYRSILLVMMRMEAERVVEQIKTCMAILKELRSGEVYASETTSLYPLGDAMVFEESAYTNALDAIQQRDNDMAGQWLEMAKLAQQYAKALTKYLKQEPAFFKVVGERKKDMALDVVEHDTNHMAEPGLEEWSHAAALDFDIHDGSSSLSADEPVKKQLWRMDPIVTKNFSQKNVKDDDSVAVEEEDESREELYELVIVDLASKVGIDRDPVTVDVTAAFDDEWILPTTWKSASAVASDDAACRAFYQMDAALEDQFTARQAMRLFESSDSCKGSTDALVGHFQCPRKLPQTGPPVAQQ